MFKQVKPSQSFGLDAVNVQLLRSDDGRGAKWKSLPLVVSPRWDPSLTFLCAWMEANRGWIDEMMLQFGAVLFRGFEVQSCRDFERAALSFRPDLNDSYRGTSPRTVMEGTTYVFSAADVPVNFPIAQHIEMSFLDAPPRHIFFGCMRESRSAGGETSLCDFRRVYSDLSPSLRQKFLTKRIRYTRTHKKVGTAFTFDVADRLGWPQLFGTSDPAEVERICKEEGIPMRWGDPNGDTFTSVSVQEAFQRHPVSMDPVWFNHSIVFHWTTFPVELFYAFLRTYELRLLLHCVLVSIFCVVKYGLLGHKMSLESTYGDGTPISVGEMHQVRGAVRRNMVFNRWHRGDVLCIDNFSTSHGRQPTFDGGRKVVVAWSDPLRKENVLMDRTRAELIAEGAPSRGNKTDRVIESPQERTPESTLDTDEAQDLKVFAKGFAMPNGDNPTVQLVVGNANPQGTLASKEAQELKEKLGISTNDTAGPNKNCTHPTLLHASSDFWTGVE